MTKYYTANVDPSRLIVVTNHAGTVAPGKCRVRQATKEELDELDKLLGPVDKSILAPNGGAKGIYALQEPHFRMPRNPAREEAEAKERAKKKSRLSGGHDEKKHKVIPCIIAGKREEYNMNAGGRACRNENIYALYKGEENIMDGTLDEIARARHIKRDTVQYMLTAAYRRRVNEPSKDGKRRCRLELVLIERRHHKKRKNNRKEGGNRHGNASGSY